MRENLSSKAAPRRSWKLSAVELAVLLALCPLAGVGAGLAFESVPVGLLIAGLGLFAVAAYGSAERLGQLLRRPRPVPRDRRIDSHRLSVTDISIRRRAAAGPEATAPASTPDSDVATPADPDRIVPFPVQSIRQV